MERWRPIEDFPAYEVSNMGHVRSYVGKGNAYEGKRRLKAPHVLRPGKAGSGYAFVQLGRKKYRYVHRLVAGAFCTKPKGWVDNHRKWVVNHKNNQPLDNKASNLEWVTRSANNTWCPLCQRDYSKVQIDYDYEDHRLG